LSTTRDHAYIKSLFPEIDDIANADVRDKVVRTWLALLEASNYEAIEDCPYSLDPNVTINLVEHVQGTTRGVVALANVIEEVHGITLDRDRLLSAILLHDASKLLEWKVDGAAKSKSPIGELFPHAFLAGHYALREGLDIETAHLIVSHTNAMNQLPRLPEGVVIHYVDMAFADIVRAAAGLSLHLKY
jgi:hypothetical protein